MADNIFQLSNVSLIYNKDKKNTVMALESLNLEIKSGERWAIIGASGCGKSTMLYLLSGIMLPSSGKIFYKGQPFNGPSDDIALILQDYGLFPWKTVFQNVSLALSIKKVPKNEVKTRVLSILDKLGIESQKNKYPRQLSGGQRQRVAIARALVQNPKVLLMDEPFSALDAITKESLESLLLNICNKVGLTLIFVTHNIEEAVRIGEKIALVKDGKISQIYGSDNKIDQKNNRVGFYDKCDELRMGLGVFEVRSQVGVNIE